VFELVVSDDSERVVLVDVVCASLGGRVVSRIGYIETSGRGFLLA